MTITNDLAVLAGGAGGVNTGGFMRNRIINGAMVIDQRNAGAQLTSAGDGTWVTDRFICYHNIATVNLGQNLNAVTPPAGFSYYLGMQVTATATASASQYTNFQHYVEGYNMGDLAWGTANAKPITISFWVRSSLTGTYGIGVQNAGSDYGYPATYTISAANTWEYKTITIVGPTTGTWNTTNGRGIAMIFDLGMGSNFRFTAGSWQSGNVQGVTGAVSLNQNLNATWYITGVQLEVGSVATPFERRLYGQELVLCQRYLPSFSYGGGSNPYFGNGMAWSSTSAYYVIPFIVQPRVPPTGLYVNSAGYFAGFLASSATSNCTSVAFGGASSVTAFIRLDGMSGLTAGNATMIYMNNSAALMYFTGCEL